MICVYAYTYIYIFMYNILRNIFYLHTYVYNTYVDIHVDVYVQKLRFFQRHPSGVATVSVPEVVLMTLQHEHIFLEGVHDEQLRRGQDLGFG